LMEAQLRAESVEAPDFSQGRTAKPCV